jgi:hypothetical protein
MISLRNTRKKIRKFLAAEKRHIYILWAGFPKKRLQPPRGKKKPNPKDGTGAKKVGSPLSRGKILPNHDKSTQNQKKNPQIFLGRKKGIFIYYGRASRRKGSNLLAAKKSPPPL